MKDSARYVKIVAWSEEDQCYVGSAPGLILGGCHGDDERQVFDELYQIVEEAIDLYREDGQTAAAADGGAQLGQRSAGRSVAPCRAARSTCPRSKSQIPYIPMGSPKCTLATPVANVGSWEELWLRYMAQSR